jgi:hypothetical protein
MHERGEIKKNLTINKGILELINTNWITHVKTEHNSSTPVTCHLCIGFNKLRRGVEADINDGAYKLTKLGNEAGVET